ncbi:MAG: dicarboxylate/amino acid:cation symporter [Desulfovibrionaceae bacterium]|nr:dicarboxylate/amino acid:cation symporter [Desulfovibrionaceae bacterium]
MEEKRSIPLLVLLLLGVIIGIVIGLYANNTIMSILQSIKYILGQIILFMIPLVIVAFITPAVAKMRSHASKMLGTMLFLAYSSSVGAALFAMICGYSIIPSLHITSTAQSLQKLPEMLFTLNIPPLFSVMSALVFSLFFGVAIAWTQSELLEKITDEFNDVVLVLVQRIIIPILPFFIMTTFAILTFEGKITKQLPIFIQVILLVIVGHLLWLTLLYTIAGIVSKKNPLQLIKHYGPVYFTAVGTMSSAATLPVALTQVRKANIIHPEITNFAIPLGATVHLCGSVLTETFFIMAVSQILTGALPTVGTMILFIFLLGIFAIGAPGVPGGTLMASLGLISAVIGFDDTGIALMLTIFALQDSFGTACNLTGDGALALIMDGIFKKELSSKPHGSEVCSA